MSECVFFAVFQRDADADAADGKEILKTNLIDLMTRAVFCLVSFLKFIFKFGAVSEAWKSLCF